MEPLTACPNCKNVTIIGRNPSKKIAIIFNPRCGQWNCDFCWQLNRDEWKHVAVKGTVELLDAGASLQFITITGKGYYTPTSSIYFMRQNWPKLRKRIEYHNQQYVLESGFEFAYMLIPERHKSGVAHWHILACVQENHRKWYKDNAYAVGFGHQAFVRPVKNGVQSANYVTKYLLKDAGGIDWPKGFKRARVNEHWPKPSDVIPDGFSYERIREECELEEQIWDLKALEWKIADKREGKNVQESH